MKLEYKTRNQTELFSDSQSENMPENSNLLPVTSQPKKFKADLFDFDKSCQFCCEAVFCPSFLVYKTQKHLDEKIG